jgi:hypothetical protein
VRAFGFKEGLSGEQPFTFFFLDEKEAKNQASSDGGSHGATRRRGLACSRAASKNGCGALVILPAGREQ